MSRRSDLSTKRKLCQHRLWDSQKKVEHQRIGTSYIIRKLRIFVFEHQWNKSAEARRIRCLSEYSLFLCEGQSPRQTMLTQSLLSGSLDPHGCPGICRHTNVFRSWIETLCPLCNPLLQLFGGLPIRLQVFCSAHDTAICSYLDFCIHWNLQARRTPPLLSPSPPSLSLSLHLPPPSSPPHTTHHTTHTQPHNHTTTQPHNHTTIQPPNHPTIQPSNHPAIHPAILPPISSSPPLPSHNTSPASRRCVQLH